VRLKSKAVPAYIVATFAMFVVHRLISAVDGAESYDQDVSL
jgi:hypothetical protein